MLLHEGVHPNAPIVRQACSCTWYMYPWYVVCLSCQPSLGGHPVSKLCGNLSVLIVYSSVVQSHAWRRALGICFKSNVLVVFTEHLSHSTIHEFIRLLLSVSSCLLSQERHTVGVWERWSALLVWNFSTCMYMYNRKADSSVSKPARCVVLGLFEYS